MATPETRQRVESAKAPPLNNNVAVVGGGVAGMACALRLAQRGYKVTLSESAPMLGGNARPEKQPRTILRRLSAPVSGMVCELLETRVKMIWV